MKVNCKYTGANFIADFVSMFHPSQITINNNSKKIGILIFTWIFKLV
jgi:hypothetical protein